MTRVFYENITEQTIPESYVTLMKKVIRTCVEEQYPSHKFEVNLTLCDNDTIHEINKEQRGIDAPTDVLSFPFYDFDSPDITTLLGDIIISIDKAKAQAEAYGHSLKRELCFLAAHSALHLLGYDHEDEKEREAMEDKQRAILEGLGIKR